MITLEKDRLKFSFPALADELRKLISAEVDQCANRLIAEDRAKAFDHLVKTDYRYESLGEAQKHEMRQKLLTITPQSLRHRIVSYSGQARFVDSVVSNGNSGGTGHPPNSWQAKFNNSTAKGEWGATISFQRTLRIPDDGKTYPLPPGLGTFPVSLVDDHAKKIPAAWLKRGGVMMPIYQAEALWLAFKSDYPCALKIGTGKINAVSGQSWTPILGKNPQDYVILPEQPWLDGYCVEKGYIRQFVAMPLGDGYTAEEQLTGSGEHGGIQLQVYPLKASIYVEGSVKPRFPKTLSDLLPSFIPPPRERMPICSAPVAYKPGDEGLSLFEQQVNCVHDAAMGLGAGGKIHQEIYEDERPLEAWDSAATSRCFVHLCNSVVWRQITGQKPPHPPFDAAVYAKHGLPWFDYYRDDIAAVPGSRILKKLKSVFQIARQKAEPSLIEQKPVEPTLIIQYGEKRRPDKVREWVE
jgi:hypothetical protein